jgi:protein involved in polysaccharide export with SLBB domain
LSSLVVLSAGCQSAAPPHTVNDTYQEALIRRRTEYRIKPGDVIKVSFYGETKFDQELLVLPDGRTDPYFMNNTLVAQSTVAQLEEEIKRHYANEVRNPEIKIQVTPAKETIYLQGAVKTPGVQDFTLNMTLSQVLARAGGYLDTASIDDVILRRSVNDPRKPDIFVIDLNDESEEIMMLPDDHVWVCRTWWIVVRDYLREYIWGMLPIDPRALFFGI